MDRWRFKCVLVLILGVGCLLAFGEEDVSVAACSEVTYGTMAEGQELKDLTLEEVAPQLARPPNPDGPVLVDVGLFVISMPEIDPVHNTFRVEAYLDMMWCDPRLAFDAETAFQGRKIYLEEAAHEVLQRIWWPDVTLVNEVESRAVENEELLIFPDGTVEYQERFSATLEAHYDLRQFPFDEQKLEIELESFAWSSEFLQFHQREKKIGFSSDFELPEWHTEAVHTHLREVQEIRDRAPFSELVLEVIISRRSGFFIWKILIPLMVLVSLSWSVFWMIGDGLADRMSVSLTGVLTVVAYQFIIVADLPRVPYFTFMDVVLTLSFATITLTVAENVYVNVLYLRGRESRAQRVDSTCRWLFPVLYFGALLVAAVVYL